MQVCTYVYVFYLDPLKNPCLKTFRFFVLPLEVTDFQIKKGKKVHDLLVLLRHL